MLAHGDVSVNEHTNLWQECVGVACVLAHVHVCPTRALTLTLTWTCHFLVWGPPCGCWIPVCFWCSLEEQEHKLETKEKIIQSPFTKRCSQITCETGPWLPSKLTCSTAANKDFLESPLVACQLHPSPAKEQSHDVTLKPPFLSFYVFVLDKINTFCNW